MKRNAEGTDRSVPGGDVLAARPKSETLSTGLPGLDRVFTGILPGDNIVWQVDVVEDYRPVRRPVRPRRDRPRETARLLPLRPPPRARPPGDRRGDPHPPSRSGLRNVHRPDPQGDRGGGPRRLLRLRLPLGPRGRLVQRPDAGQLLHGHLPVPVRPRHGDLLRPSARRTLVRRRLVDPRHDAAADRRLPPQGAPLRPPAEGRPAFLPDDVSPPRPGREGVPPPHGERGALRGAGGPLEAARGRRLAHARHLGPEAPPGAGSDRRGPARRAPRGGSAGDLRPASPDDGHPRRAPGGPRLPVVRPRRPALPPEADDRHGTDRREVGRDAPRPRDPLQDGPPLEGPAGDARLVLHRLRRLLHVPRPQRMLAGAARPAQRRHLHGRGGRGEGADPVGHLPGLPPGAVRGDARVFRPVADHRPVELASSRTASATPSRGSTTASSARTRDRRRSASMRSSRRSAPCTPAR